MPMDLTLATAVALPKESAVSDVFTSLNLADAFAIRLPPGASDDPAILAGFIFAHQPAWIGTLMNLRDMIAGAFGLKTAKDLALLANAPGAKRVGIFRIYSTDATEILLGEDDKHLDFRLSVRCSDGQESARHVTVSTVVHCHNLLGRVYLFIIAPFHRAVVKASLRRAAQIGWPRAVR